MKAALRKYSVFSGDLILVNASYPCHGGFREDSFVPAGGGSGVLLERRAAAALGELMEEIHGWNSIVPVSGWRSGEEQKKLWEDSVEANGEDFTKKYVAAPGCSEHQTGLAIDLGLRQKDMDFIRPDFPDSGTGRSFRERAARYGFIERYPSGKEHITGIAHEPWHFRFVGTPHAEIMSEMGLCLEEYHSLLMRFPYGQRQLCQETNGRRFTISYLPERELAALSGAERGLPRMISGNNINGFIITTVVKTALPG